MVALSVLCDWQRLLSLFTSLLFNCVAVGYCDINVPMLSFRLPSCRKN